MKLGVLFSGGKDSTYAIYKAKEKNEIVCLISIISKNPASYMFHTPNISITKLQAEAMGLPLIEQSTLGEKEKELDDLKKALIKAKKKFSIEGIVTGAVASNYQRERIQKICDELNLACINPLWSSKPEELLRSMIRDGFRFILSGIAAEGFDKSWLGRVITEKDVDMLVKMNKKVGIHLTFEGGEAESLVVDCPLFKHKILVLESETIMEDNNTGNFRILKAELE
jgi:diphthine-ammonia ligase